MAAADLVYLFDFNLGFLPYLPGILLLFFIVSIYGVIKRRRIHIILCFALFATVLGYSRTVHINCGMSGMARYSAWAAPIMLLFVATQFPLLLRRPWMKRAGAAFMVGCALCTSLIGLKSVNWWFMDHTPIARIVLDRAPAAYHPFPYTFISRTLHAENGYSYEANRHTPVVYTNQDGFARKILVPRGTQDQLADMLYGGPDELAFLEEQAAEIARRNRNFSYINVPNEMELSLTKDWRESFDPLEQADLDAVNTGVYAHEETFCWLSPQAAVTLKSGDLKRTGLELAFTISPDITPFTEEPLRLVIQTEGVTVAQIPLDTLEPYRITISGDTLPETSSGYYTFLLDTNGVFNPNRMVGSPDTRDLAIALSYMGPVRD